MTTYVFPGQGSQRRGMGETLFSEFPDIVKLSDKILGYSIVDLCLSDPDGQLSQTQYTQPAIYIVNALQYMKKVTDNGKPDYVAGHSLGEYNALLVANVFNFESGLRLVQKRGELMAQANGGGMAAIIGIEAVEVERILNQFGLRNVSIANYNSYTQIVISGPKEEVHSTKSLFGSAFIPLNVSGAFHSSYMRVAEQQFASFLNEYEFNAPSIQVIANINAAPYQADKVKSYLAQQITHPVQWTRTIEYLLEKGELDFHEVGTGAVLTGLINQIRRGK